MALTDTAIRAAKPKDAPYKLADNGGLHLLVNPSGSRLWRLKYRIAGREKLLSRGETKQNERIKRDFTRHLKEARGRSEATIDAVRKALASKLAKAHATLNPSIASKPSASRQS